jgi:arylsulfatase A-like enzyme
VSWPGRVAEGVTSDLPVSHLDLLATVAELAAVPGDLVPLGHQGASLAAVLRDPAAPAPWGRARRVRHALTFRGAVGNKWNLFRWMQNKDVDGATPLEVATVLDGTKILFDPRRRHRYEVYDLVADPGEERPIPDRDGRWRSTVASTWAWYESTRIDFKDVQPSPEELEALRSLGYVD